MKFILPIIFTLLVFTNKAQTTDYEAKKADFVVNIARYVRWGNLDELPNTFTIGVVRDSEMAQRLESYFEQRTILGKKVKIEEFYRLDEVQACELIYLSEKVFVTDKTLNFINTKINGHQTLLISNDAKRIGMINFYVRNNDNQLCFEVNKNSIENAGLIPQRSLLKHKNASIKQIN